MQKIKKSRFKAIMLDILGTTLFIYAALPYSIPNETLYVVIVEQADVAQEIAVRIARDLGTSRLAVLPRDNTQAQLVMATRGAAFAVNNAFAKLPISFFKPFYEHVDQLTHRLAEDPTTQGLTLADIVEFTRIPDTTNLYFVLACEVALYAGVLQPGVRFIPPRYQTLQELISLNGGIDVRFFTEEQINDDKTLKTACLLPIERPELACDSNRRHGARRRALDRFLISVRAADELDELGDGHSGPARAVHVQVPHKGSDTTTTTTT